MFTSHDTTVAFEGNNSLKRRQICYN